MLKISNFKSVLICALVLAFAATLFGQSAAQKKEIERLYDSGEINLMERKFLQAIADFRKIIRLDPEDTSARFNLGRAYLGGGAYDKALVEFEAHRQKEPDHGWTNALIGEVYLRQGDADRAIEFLTEKIADNEFVGYFETRAAAYAKKGLLTEAIGDYAEALRQYNYPGYLVRRARLYARIGDKKAAIQDYLEFLENFPDHEKVRDEVLKLGAAETDLPARLQSAEAKPNPAAAKLFQEAFDLFVEDGKDSGLHFLKKAAAADPKFAAPRYYRGLIYDSQILYAQAFDEFKKAYEIKPNFVEPRLKYADRIRSNGYFEPALLHYDRVLEINPREARAFFGRGAAFVEQADIFSEEEIHYEKIVLWKRALAEFNKAVELNPKLAEAYRARADVLLNLGKLREAAADYSLAAANSRRAFSAYAYESQADALCHSGETEKAAAAEAKARETGIADMISEPCRERTENATEKPETAEEWLKSGLSLLEKRNLEAAANALTASLNIQETAPALTARGKTRLLIGDYDAAIADLSKALRLNPNEEESLKIRAVALRFQNKDREAISDYAALIKLKPDNALYYAGRAELYAKTNQIAAAVADYTQAVNLESNYQTEFRFKRGDLYLAQKNYRDAVADYNTVVEEMPLRVSVYPKIAAIVCALGDRKMIRSTAEIYKKHTGLALAACQ